MSDAIRKALGPEGFVAYCRGTAIAALDEQDYERAIHYTQLANERCTAHSPNGEPCTGPIGHNGAHWALETGGTFTDETLLEILEHGLPSIEERHEIAARMKGLQPLGTYSETVEMLNDPDVTLGYLDRRKIAKEWRALKDPSTQCGQRGGPQLCCTRPADHEGPHWELEGPGRPQWREQCQQYGMALGSLRPLVQCTLPLGHSEDHMAFDGGFTWGPQCTRRGRNGQLCQKLEGHNGQHEVFKGVLGPYQWDDTEPEPCESCSPAGHMCEKHARHEGQHDGFSAGDLYQWD